MAKRITKTNSVQSHRPRGNDLTILSNDSGILSVPNCAFRGFIENLPVLFYAVEPYSPHRPLYISRTVEKFGYPHEQWLTDPNIWLTVIHEEDRDRILGDTKEAMSRGEGIDFEYRIVGADGTIFWVRDRSCFIRDNSGTPICWQGVILDVTERRWAVLETQKRERLYRTLSRHIPKSAVLMFGKDLKYTLADGQYLTRYGLDKDQLEGQTPYDVFPPNLAEQWATRYRKALAGESVTFETSLNGDDHVQVDLFPVRDENKEIFAGMVVLHDVTEERRAAIALAESETRYRQLFENATDVIYVHDLDGNYISINDAATRVFGYTKDEALAMNMKAIAAPDQLKVIKRKLAKKVAGGSGETSYEVDCITKQGNRITLEVNSSLILNDGRPVAIQGIARDITERKRAEELNRKNEERYRDLFENANDLIYTHDMEGNFTSLNRAGEMITGYSRNEALSMNIESVVAPDYLDVARTMTASKIKNEHSTTYELEIIAKDGRRVFLELSTRLVFSDGEPIGVQGIARDISDRKESQRSLQNAVSLFASTFESTADGIVVLGLDRKVVTWNRKFVEMWNFPDQVLAEMSGSALVTFAKDLLVDPESFVANLDALYQDPLATTTDILELRDGRTYERYSQPQFMDGKPVGRVCCYRDITERKRAEEKLRHNALHDTLTSLPNRIAFMNHLREAIERAKGYDIARFAVLFLDLDRFKVINDSLGHATGDKLLIAFAERLRSCVRPGDVVARLGGDEFTILLNRSGEADDVKAVAERLQAKISEPFHLDNYEVFTSASIGIILSNNTIREPEDFLRDADAAMYRAKESGKARYEVFDREMHVRNMNLLQVETDLRHAVERNEFEVLYQPIVDLDTGRVSEFEALIRWRHPKHGLVSPDEFVGVAEETGLIIPIGKWILERSCHQVKEWQRRFDMPLSISVNLSAKQLMHPTLTAQINDILTVTGLAPNQLKLEVTESTVMEHSDRSMKVLSELDRVGVSLSTDDFGTGYSSLSYLQKFPFDRLKIDRSFIKIMDTDEKSGAIVKTILMLGENLNIEVVAEGIETAGQLEKLRSLGCKMGQGYFFSRPIDVEAVEALLASGSEMLDLAQTPLFHAPGPVIEAAEIH